MKMKKLFILLISSFVIATVANATEYDCGKKYCKAMSSCDEAYYKLEVCGDRRLDRDGDGVPCENVCGKGGKKQSKKSKKQIESVIDKDAVEENIQSKAKKTKS